MKESDIYEVTVHHRTDTDLNRHFYRYNNIAFDNFGDIIVRVESESDHLSDLGNVDIWGSTAVLAWMAAKIIIIRNESIALSFFFLLMRSYDRENGRRAKCIFWV